MKEFSDEEQADLNEMFISIAHTQCFAVLFETGFSLPEDFVTMGFPGKMVASPFRGFCCQEVFF